MKEPRLVSVTDPGFLSELLGVGDLPDGRESGWLYVHGGELPRPIMLRLGQLPDGRLACVGLHFGVPLIEGGELSAEPVEVAASDLRMPLAAIIDHIVKRGRNPKDPAHALLSGVLGAATKVERPTRRRLRPGRRVIEMDELKTFAEEYERQLMLNARKPIRATAHQLNMSDATARRRRARCIEMGLLTDQHDDSTTGKG